MPRFTRRSKANEAADHTQGSSFDPLLSLQPASELTATKASPGIHSANDLLGGKKRTYTSYQASNSHTAPETPQSTTKSQPTAKRVRKRGPISDHREVGGSFKENRGGRLSRDGGANRDDDGIDGVAIGRRASLVPNCDDTHSPHNASNVLFDHNVPDFGNAESDVEDECDWHDEPTSKETSRQPTRASEAVTIERASWGASRASSPRPGSQNTGASGDTVLDGDDSTPGPGGGNTHSAVMRPNWPPETDMVFSNGRTRIRLMNQPTIVRLVLQDAIENVHAFLLFRNAYPQPGLVVSSTKRALVIAATARLPGAAHVHNRLVSDEEYFLNMTVIPRARIPIIRNSIKERCNAMVAAEYMALDSSISIADLVAKERDEYTYIYPVARVGDALHERLVRRSEPYRNNRIINVIRSMYFTGGVSSFTTRFDHLFPRFRDNQGAMKAEVPQPMVALVATALYSAVFDWQNGEKHPVDFTTGAYIDVYDGNFNTLENMRVHYPNKYHTMMADIYVKVSSTVGSTTGIAIADIPIAELDG